MEVKVHQPGKAHTTAASSPAEPETTHTPQVAKKQPGGVVLITLQDGRTVGIRRMGPMDRMRMCSIIGAENSKNELYLSNAVPAYCTASIDGDIIPRSQTVLALEALAERLGDEGLLQVVLAISEHFPESNLNEIVKDYTKRQEIKNL